MRRRPALLAVALLLAGCTQTTRGSGSLSASPSDSSRSGSATTGTDTSAPPSTSSTPAPLPGEFLRTPRDSAIGDPGTADLCVAVGPAPFASLGAYTADLDSVQYPPGCSFTLSAAGAPALNVSVFAAARTKPREAEGRTERSAAGLRVYGYPFDEDTGGCERDVVADRVRLVVDALTRGSAAPDRKLSCAATTALADRVAQVVAAGTVPRLALAQPSVLDLNACAVARRSGITGLGEFASGGFITRGFELNCEVRAEGVFLFINATLATTLPQAAPTVVAGHDIYRLPTRPGLCSYASVQGLTADGVHEEVTAVATQPTGGAASPQLCAQTTQALARYLTTAGLP